MTDPCGRGYQANGMLDRFRGSLLVHRPIRSPDDAADTVA
jgi:hypothetical protein